MLGSSDGIPSHDVARRRLMELEMDMGGPADYADARTHLTILLEKAKKSDDLVILMFKMGRCCEAARDEKEAVRFYREALKHKASPTKRSLPAPRHCVARSS